jgi:two-component system response regulator NreC
MTAADLRSPGRSTAGDDITVVVADDRTNTEIAAQLHLSTRTVETHRAHIQRKLRRTSRAELVH